MDAEADKPSKAWEGCADKFLKKDRWYVRKYRHKEKLKDIIIGETVCLTGNKEDDKNEAGALA